MKSTSYKSIFLLVQIATICVFVGRAYQHWFWDAPYRTLLWDEVWMSGLVELMTSMTWEQFITSMTVDEGIQSSIRATGCLYALCAVVALFIRRVPRILTYLLPIGAFFLVVLAALYCKEKFFSLGQFFEYTLQFSSPIFLFLLVYPDSYRGNISTKMIFWMKVAIALTFTCHGLYAVNFYPLPGLFVEMTINILGVSEATARSFLLGAGIMDFIISILIFVPGRIGKLALLYAVIWGLGTALARIWAHFYIEFPVECLHQWAHQSIYRLCHSLIPLVLLVYYYQNTATNSEH